MPTELTGKNTLQEEKAPNDLGFEMFLKNCEYFEKKRIEKDVFIDKLQIDDFNKAMLKSISPHDAFDHLDNPLERFFFVQTKLNECKIIEKSNPPDMPEWERLKDIYHKFQLFWDDAGKGAAKVLKESIQSAQGAAFEEVKSREDDILLAAKEMGVEILFPRELFVKREMEKGFKAQAYGQPLKMKDLLSKFPVCDRKIYRLIETEESKESPLIKRIKRGVFLIKKNCESKIKGALEL
jgi:hypothetical protein